MSVEENHFQCIKDKHDKDTFYHKGADRRSCKKANAHQGKMTYSKSVCSLSSARDVKTKALFLMPSTQAESGELAKMRPEGLRLKKANIRVGARGGHSSCVDVRRFYQCHVLTMSVALLQLVTQP